MLNSAWFRWSGYVLLCTFAFAQEKAPLKVVVIQGDGALNDIRRQAAHDPVVEVRDEYDRHVPNARVVFQLPASGAGGAFADGHKESIVTTDQQGRAVARGLKPNAVEGRFPIRVTASSGGRQGTGVVWQSNTLAGGGEPRHGAGGKRKYVIIGLIGGAAAGAVAATRGGGKSPGAVATPPTTLSPGTVTVGGPR